MTSGRHSSGVFDATDGSRPPAEGEQTLQALLPALAWLDDLLARAADQVPKLFGAHVQGDRYRGLYVSAADVELALRRPPGEPFPLRAHDDEVLAAKRREATAPGTRLQLVADAQQLSDFDIDVVLLALAPELDRRYERLYAYLQDDIGARRPTVDLALQLFAADAAERFTLRQRFASEQPLIAGRVVTLDAGGNGAPLSLLASVIRLDGQIVQALLGHDGLDPRLTNCCHYAPRRAAGDCELPAEMLARLQRYLATELRESHLPRLRFFGPPGSGRRSAAAALASAVDRPLLVLDLALIAAQADADDIVACAVREAWLRGAILYAAGADSLRNASTRASVLAALAPTSSGAPAGIILGFSEEPGDIMPDAPTIVLAAPSFDRRRILWARAVEHHGLAVDDQGVDRLAARFELSPRQIGHAAMEAAARQSIDRAESAPTDLAQLFASARHLSGAQLAQHATRIEPVHRFADLVLPADARAQLSELCSCVEQRSVVMEAWGFGKQLSRGKGVNALFSGPPGTGKTMAAEVVANALGVDLFRVELAGVVSKYIGETEKNLDRIFAAAEHANAVILFDEADALFGKRSEVHDAHDRYANIEISYLLQRMEEYGGVAILSTNLRGNLDAAFLRRLAFTIHFPLPDLAGRRRLWEQVWPAETPLSTDLPLDLVAAKFTISGGHIRNIALASAYLAAADGGVVTLRHLLAATSREYQKLGKALTEDELAPFRRLLPNTS